APRSGANRLRLTRAGRRNDWTRQVSAAARTRQGGEALRRRAAAGYAHWKDLAQFNFPIMYPTLYPVSDQE
ncbi:hypothetical protein, partial [Nitrosococcus oceani]